MTLFNDPQRLTRFTAVLAIAVATVLAVIKAVTWLLTGSLGMLATAVDSLLDVGMSGISLFAIRTAQRPPDREHRFGHGKAEPLAAMAQGAFIAGSSLLLLMEAGRRLQEPVILEQTSTGFAVMVLAIVMTLLLVAWQYWVVRRTQSLAIAADMTHYRVDILVNVFVMIGLVLVNATQKAWIDSAIAASLAVYLLRTSWQISKQALDMLLDRELPDDEREKIGTLIRAEPSVRDFHDLRTRAAGSARFIQFHLELDSDLTLAEAHEVTDRVEKAIEALYPETHVAIHQEPYGIEDHRDNF
ncbi:MAG: cation diffusion facilitator family transporter [Dongiaceae bacterium]